MGTRGGGVKRPGHEADHSLPTSAEVQNMWIYTSTPQHAFMASCLISYAEGQVYVQVNMTVVRALSHALSYVYF
jgi:hypothetical protein